MSAASRGELLAVSRGLALSIHREAIRLFGGAGGVRDEGMLESALAQPLQTFDGEELYPSVEEKAARYAYGIIANHPFVDGNKRVGAALLGTCMRMGGIPFRPSHDEFERAILGVASGELGYESLLEWVRRQA